MRKLLLPALAACSLLAVSAPVASAHKAHAASLGSRLADARGAIAGLKKTVQALFNNDAGQKDAIHTVDTKVHDLGVTVQGILNGVPAIVTGLTAIQTALQDPTTGLVGLNHARPQFGAFNGADGAILGGTGQATGASGPKTAATHAANTGGYIVDFGNDVSKRVYTVNPFPLGPFNGTTVTVVANATNCAASAGATALCQGYGDTATGNPNHVLVLLANSKTGGPADDSFSVTAISG